MEQQDIRQAILWQLEDIDDVERLCQVDQIFKKLCSRKEFWIHWYQSKNIMLTKYFNTIEEWIVEYRYVVSIQEKAKALLDYINSDEERILVFTYQADLLDYDYLLLGQNDLELIKILKYHEGQEIQCEIIKNYIYHVPPMVVGWQINEFKVTPIQIYEFLYRVLYRGIDIKKDKY